jgi:hypothetical protein
MKQLQVSASNRPSSGCTELVRRLYTRRGFIFGGRDLVLHNRSWGESRM